MNTEYSVLIYIRVKSEKDGVELGNDRFIYATVDPAYWSDY